MLSLAPVPRRLVLILLALLCLASPPARAAEAPQSFERIEDVLYHRKFGTALTLDVFKPSKPNGCGVLFMVSGGFFSSHEAINTQFMRPFLNRGYTVFAVVHGSQPRFVIPEIVEDIHRAVRFVKHNASKYGINPDKLGITGASAGGHLSITMATQGRPGKTDAKDPIDRESSVIQAAACFFPPTDFLNYGKEGEDAVGVGTLANFKPAFGSRADTAESRQSYGKEISPIYFVTDKMAPSLILHGDADRLVPIQQAETFIKKAQDLGVKAKLINRPGKEHGWADIVQDLEIFGDWFDEHLRGIKK